MKNSEKGMLSLFTWYTLINAANGIYAPYISLYYLQKGFSVFQIGILAAVAPVTILTVQPAWAILSDRINNRLFVFKILLVGSGFSVILYLLGHQFYQFVLITFLFSAFYTSIMPLSESHMITYTMQQNRRFGLLRLGGTLGFGAIAPIAGRLLNDKNIKIIFFVIPVIFVLIYINMAMIPKIKNKVNIKDANKGRMLDLLKNRQVSKVLLFIFIMFLALNFHQSFISVYITQMRYSSTMVGIAMFLQCAGEIPVLLLIDKYMKKYNVIHILLFAGIILGFRFLLYYFATGIIMIFVGQALSGITMMTIIYCSIVFMGNEAPEHLRSTGQSLRVIVQCGIASIFGSIGGGCFSKLFSLRQTYLAAALLVLATCMAVVIPEQRNKGKTQRIPEAPAGEAGGTV